MQNKIPAIRNNTEMRFVCLGDCEEIDMTLNRKTNRMTFERAFWNEKEEDWDSKEVYLEDIQAELEGYGFLTIGPKPMTIRQLMSHFSFIYLMDGKREWKFLVSRVN